MDIERISVSSAGQPNIITCGGLVYTTVTANSESTSLSEQTRITLEHLDQHLAEARSDKTRIIQAAVYLQDMNNIEEMDQVWCAWIGPEENRLQRACIKGDLGGNNLIEIVVTARQYI